MKSRRFSLDLALDDDRPPQAGDVIVTARTVNRVTAARPVESRVWGNRWAVTVSRIDSEGRFAANVEPGARCFTTTAYKRGETPAEFFGQISVS